MHTDNNVAFYEQNMLPNENIAYEEVDTIAPELSGANGIYRFDSDGNMYHLSVQDGNPVVVKQQQENFHNVPMNTALDTMKFSEENLSQAFERFSLNLDVYRSVLSQIDFYQSEEGQDYALQFMVENHGMSRDTKALATMDSVMNRLGEAMEKLNPADRFDQYKYTVTKNNEDNAFAYFNHTLVANEGLFKSCNYDQDYVASMLAHELGHAKLNHMELATKEKYASLLGLNLLGVNVDGTFVDHLLTDIEDRGIAKSKEKAADAIAFDYVVTAGYNPGALAARYAKELYKARSDTKLLDSTFDTVIEKNKKHTGQFIQLVEHDNHPLLSERMNNYLKKIQDYGNNHVSIKKDGTLLIDGVSFYKPSSTNDKLGIERSCLAMGNLATAFHDGMDRFSVYAIDNTLMVGNLPILECKDNDISAKELAEKLNKILVTSRESNVENIFKTGKTDIKMFSNLGVRYPDYQVIPTVADFSFMRQFNQNGEEVAPKHVLDSEKAVKSIYDFSNTMDNFVTDTKTINLAGSFREAGHEAGKCLTKLLEEKSSVDFFDMVSKSSTDLRNTFSGTIKNYVNHMKEPEGKHFDDRYKPHVASLISNLGANPHTNRFDSMQSISLANGSTSSTAFSKLAKSFQQVSQDKEFQKAVIEEVKKNPKALANYKKIMKSQETILNNLETLRFTSLDSQIKLNNLNLDTMKKDFNFIKTVFKNQNQVHVHGATVSKDNALARFNEHSDKVYNRLYSMNKTLKALRQTYPNYDYKKYDNILTKQTKTMDRLYNQMDKVTSNDGLSSFKFEPKSAKKVKTNTHGSVFTIGKDMKSIIYGNER